MLAGARRGNSRSPTDGRRAAAGSPADDPAAEGARGPLALRLALARGRFGIELGAPLRHGPIELLELAYFLSDIRFPVDLSGGVARFRHVRGQLSSVTLALPLIETARSLAPLARPLFGRGAISVTIAPTLDGVTVGVADEESALGFDLVVAPEERGLRLVVEAARGLELSAAPHALACRLTELVLGRSAVRSGSLFLLADPVAELLRAVLPEAGGRVPSTRGVRLALGARAGARRAELVLRGELEGELPPLSARAARALETAALLRDADDRLVAGDQGARAAYLQALERAPRHPEAALRLAALDLAEGERVEAAMSTVLDVVGLSDAGLLGCRILGALGEEDAAYTAAARAAAEEPFGVLASRAWLLAARLAPDRAARRAAVDEAVVRAPTARGARWERFVVALESGELRAALGEVEHLEAAAADRAGRFDLAARAAQVLLDRGFVHEAERWFERALRYEPRSPRALAGLARALRDRGKTDRALDLLSRAATLAKGADAGIAIELALALAEHAGDLPNAVARVADVAHDAEEAPRARRLEAEWRLALGDHAGAARALARLRSLAELTAPSPAAAALSGAPPSRADAASTSSLVDALIRAAELDRDVLGDEAAARRDLALALKLAPRHRVAAAKLAELVRAPAPAAPAAPVVESRTARPAPNLELPSDDGDGDDVAELELKVDELSAKLRANPRDVAVAEELAGLLEQLGRDLELLALLSARIEDTDPPDAVPLLARRREVFRRLAERARAEGRLEEASLYEAMLDA